MKAPDEITIISPMKDSRVTVVKGCRICYEPLTKLLDGPSQAYRVYCTRSMTF
jgi:hypothetical protein